MRNRIAAAAAAGILTIGMAALPSAASASEVAPSTDGLAGSTAISGQIDQDMAVCTDKTCDAVQHVRKTNQQIKSDIDTAKQHAEQLHQNAHEDADALRRRIEGLTKSADEGDEPVPETLRELLGLLKLGIAKVADGTFGKADGSSTDGDAENDDVTLADRFRDMREDWRQLRIQRIEDAEERKAERKAARNGVTFESVSH
mgnify:FL=1